MQVTMSMEEYNELLNRNQELEDSHQADLLYLGNKYKIELDKLRDENRKLITQNKSHVEQLNKMIEKYERMGVNVIGCIFCSRGATITPDGFPMNYCPNCGKKLGGE